MTRHLPIFILGFVVAALQAAEPPLLVEARRARAESIPQVAIQKLRTLLKTKDLPEDLRRTASHELASALLAGGETEEALWVIQPLAESGEKTARFLQADILAHAGRWAEALPLYQGLTKEADLTDAAHIAVVECFQALGQTASAIRELEKFVALHPANTGAQLRLAGLLVDAKKLSAAREILEKAKPRLPEEGKWSKYVEGRLLLASDQAAPALALFEEVLRDLHGVSESLLFGATLGSMEARAILNGYESADGVLEKFVSRYPDSRYLEAAFRRLDEVYEQEEHPTENELKKNAQKPPARRAALAQYYLARMYQRVNKPDKAATALETFLQLYATHPLVPMAYLMQADDFLKKDNLPAAVRALEAAMRQAKNDEERAAIELRTALVHYRQGEGLLAANSFRRAAQWSEKLRPPALFDAALADLSLKNYERYSEDYRALSSEYPNSPLLSSLVLEEGFTQARAGDPRAGDTLELFIHHFPRHPRQNEARLALAELALRDGDRAGTARYLQVVNASAPDAESTERAGYLSVFAADAETPPAPEKVIALAQKFIQSFPRSPLLPEVRMKLGQVFFNAGDHANAETQFTLLARESPASPYAETALFLGGQAATKWIDPGAVDRAFALFAEVVERAGPLKLYARQQQAILQSRLGKESVAVDIYDAILSAQPPPDAELRFAALCGKGDNLVLLGGTTPRQLEVAVEVYDFLATQPEITPTWRNQALYKKGRALEQLKRQPEALTAFYDVLDKSAAEGREFFWYYKAGFDAAALFEKQEDWKSAIGIYQKMAQLAGPRAAEAKARLSQLRLERFIWD
jgi:outer membrane protein assembly factor BamD (BamD/ComL family)